MAEKILIHLKGVGILIAWGIFMGIIKFVEWLDL